MIKYSESTNSEGKLEGKIDIDNGHLETLKKITEDYKIDGVEKALGFVLAIISKNGGKPIQVGGDSFVPGEAIKKKDISTSATETTDK